MQIYLSAAAPKAPKLTLFLSSSTETPTDILDSARLASAPFALERPRPSPSRDHAPRPFPTPKEGEGDSREKEKETEGKMVVFLLRFSRVIKKNKNAKRCHNNNKSNNIPSIFSKNKKRKRENVAQFDTKRMLRTLREPKESRRGLRERESYGGLSRRVLW